MPTLIQLNPKGAQELLHSIAVAHEEIASAILKLNSAVIDTVQKTWTSPTAQEFQGSFDEWASQMNVQLMTLNQLAVQLSREISDWESADLA